MTTLVTARFRAEAIIVDSESATVGGYRLLSNQGVVNGDVVDLLPGAPCILIGDNTIVRAWADVGGLAATDGLVFVQTPPTGSCMLRSQGRVDLTTAEWDAVTGEIGGLFPGALYYVGLAPGTLTSSPPFVAGQTVCQIGKAFSPTSFVIEIGAPILL